MKLLNAATLTALLVALGLHLITGSVEQASPLYTARFWVSPTALLLLLVRTVMLRRNSVRRPPGKPSKNGEVDT